MEYRIKMLPRQYEEMRQCLSNDTSAEHGCFALCATSVGNIRHSLLVKEVVPLLASDFLIQNHQQLSVKPETMLKVARKAQKEGLSICMIHTHPMCESEVEFSIADDIGNIRTFPFFYRMLPSLAHSCIVWNKHLNYGSGRVYHPNNSWSTITAIEVVGSPNLINTTSASNKSKACSVNSIFQRQAPLLGKDGQNIIATKHLGIVGCGGIGSCVSLTSVHSGFKSICSIDPDVIEATNLPRIPGANLIDVSSKTLKVNIAKRYALNFDSSIEYLALENLIEDSSITKYLKDLDGIIVTTDNTRSRAYINQFCQQHYIPLLDLGVQFVVNSIGEIVQDFGKVNFVLPGDPCLVCSMHIHPERLRAESLPKDMRDTEIEAGYIRGFNIEQPSMMPFNMQIAARGTQVITEYFSGTQTVDQNFYEKYSFHQLKGQPLVKKVQKNGDPHCLFCAKPSIYLGAGDTQPNLIKPINSYQVKSA